MVTAAKSPRSLHDSRKLQLAVALQLTDIDPTVQKATLQCLKVFHQLPLTTTPLGRPPRSHKYSATDLTLLNLPLP